MKSNSGHKCPNGHTMDPNWDSCPYCEAQERSNKQTVATDNRTTVARGSRTTVATDASTVFVPEQQGTPTINTRSTVIGDTPLSSPAGETVALDGVSAQPSNSRATVIGDVAPQAQSQETVFLPVQTAQKQTVIDSSTDTRRIVGVLVSYSWSHGGQLFPVREGKNYIGRHESAPQQACDIQVPHDQRMSGVHALILCRSGKMELIDRESSCGTLLDGEMLSSGQSYDLKNHAMIKTGSTTWTFVKIEVPATS